MEGKRIRKKGCRERRGMGSHREQTDLGEGACGEHCNPSHLTNPQENPHPPSLRLELEFCESEMQGLASRLSEGEQAQSQAARSHAVKSRRFKWGREKGPLSGIQSLLFLFLLFPGLTGLHAARGTGEGPQLGLEGGFVARRGLQPAWFWLQPWLHQTDLAG